MEVYAGYSENADYNVGRVIDAIDELGELDNTLVFWIWGDNGASMEGTITGSFNELTMQNGIPLTDEMQLQLAERYGGVEAWGNQMMAPHYSAAWAWAGNTPFKWGKQVGSHLGGTRNPLVVHWPETVRENGVAQNPLHSRNRRRADDPRHRGDPDADPHRRDRAAADARRDLRRFDEGRRGSRAPHPAVLRDDRQPGDVQGRLVALDEDGAHPVGDHAGGAGAVQARRLGSRPGPRRALLPARRLHPGEGSGRGQSGEGEGAQGALLGRGREVQRDCRCWRRSRPSSASSRRCPRSASSSSAATCRTSSRG